MACLFRLVTRFLCHLNLTMSIGFFDLLALIFRRDLIIIYIPMFLLKWDFWFTKKMFWENVCLKLKQSYFQRLHWFLQKTYCLQISNLYWALSNCLKLRYINYFSNFVLRIVHIIRWWSLKPASKEFFFINENFKFIISKSMHKLI